MDFFRFYETELWRLEGCAWLLHECDDDGYVIRFIVALDDGRRFRYDREHHVDEYGILPEKKRSFASVRTPVKEKMTRDQFEIEWSKGPWVNLP